MAKPKKPKQSGTTPDASATNVLDDMPIARALTDTDEEALASAIGSALAGNDATVSNVTIDKSAGEAFTGGRSTPVYFISCTVRRPGMKSPRPRNFVAKLVVMEGDAEAADDDAKIAKRRESYAVERRFYDAAAVRIRRDERLAIPRLLASDRDGNRPWPAVCFLMNDLRYHGYPRHPGFLSAEDASRALRWLAAFHATFFGDAPGEEWRRDLWDRGGFWTGGKDIDRGGGQGIAAQWAQTARWMQSSHPEFHTPATKSVGQRLQAAAGPVAEFLSRECSGPRGTLIHGDYKAANLFFADTNNAGCRGNDDASDDDGAGSVAAVDFQFAGAGLGAEDVAYLLFPDARGHYFDHENALLEIYHEEFISCLIQKRKGGPSSLSLASFKSCYKLSQLDFARHLLGRGWVGSTEGDARLVSSLGKTMTILDGGVVLSSKEAYAERAGQMIGR